MRKTSLRACLRVAAAAAFTWIAASARGAEPPERIDDLVRAGRFDLALRAAEEALEASRESSPTALRGLQVLRARCLFELGDYPACERSIRDLLPSLEEGSPERLDCTVRLAQALSLQGADDEALGRIEDAVRAARSPEARLALRRLSVTLALRALMFDRVAELAAAVLADRPDDTFGRFARGIALSKQGEAAEAIPDLEQGLRIPGAERDARFELALAQAALGKPDRALEQLVAIVEKDPWDEEACHQLARQLIRMRGREAIRTAASVTSYVEALKQAAGPSSRDHHLEAGGRTAHAALWRAAKWERLGAYDRAIAEVRKAAATARGDVEVRLAIAEFWARVGLLAEAERSLPPPEPPETSRSADGAAEGAAGGGATAAAEARSRIAARREELRAAAGSDLGRARLEASEAAFDEAGPALGNLLAAAARSGDAVLERQAARLLLARDPSSSPALESLVRATADPGLILPRLHYLVRLEGVSPGRPERSREIDTLRRSLSGR